MRSNMSPVGLRNTWILVNFAKASLVPDTSITQLCRKWKQTHSHGLFLSSFNRLPKHAVSKRGVQQTLTLRPLHTRAKSCDHEIVRAQKKVSACRPNTPPKSRSVATDPQV